ncbi:MAG: metallophosphoesterase [Tepidisphaeraceae bacterium]|jgi:predicted MPP superfamily phosphohydrolase
MISFFGILTAFVCLDILVWLRIDQLLRPVRHAILWRWLLGIVMTPPMLFMFFTVFAFHRMARAHQYVPPLAGAYIYIWHFLILLPTALFLFAQLAIQKLKAAYREARCRLGRDPRTPPPPAQNPQPLWSRRNFLAATALTVPPLVTFSLSEIALAQRGKFRIQPYDLSLPGWHQELDGFTIALVADVHTGIFTTPKMLSDIAAATNDIRADLILLGGDLVNLSHADLPSALDMVTRMDAPNGLFMIQGNHDVVEPERDFNTACRRRGVNLLVNEVATITPRGVPIQILGTRWVQQQEAIDFTVAKVAALASVGEPDSFPILLGHHPHCWDEAAARGLPLVLSGHTHGGQIMLSKTIGLGPLRFRYWSGLYEKPNSKLIVSNGVGNWFPLRVNAPAEILKITLHPAEI